MEEKKQNQTKKLSYEELSKAASELHVQYQKLMAEYQKAVQALNSRDFDYTSFYLQMLFKVMEHPEMYTKEFTDWASKNIEGALTSFAENFKQPEDAEKDGSETDTTPSDEA